MYWYGWGVTKAKGYKQGKIVCGSSILEGIKMESVKVQQLLNLVDHQNSLLKHRFQIPTYKDSDSVGLGGCPRISILTGHSDNYLGLNYCNKLLQY